MNSNQLSIFEQPNPEPSTQSSIPENIYTGALDENFACGTRVCVAQANPPFEHLNGRMGTIVGMTPGFASVAVEGIAVAIMLRVEALEKYSEISQYITTDAEFTELIIVGSVVECDYAYIGMPGIVRRIESYCGAKVAWVDYGPHKPLYPAPMESLSLAECEHLIC